uniref:Uncharacterized protein n=1 Tax=Oryza barthii TaxID=65489 RepID=A0A0D3HQT5_9ORYZ
MLSLRPPSPLPIQTLERDLAAAVVVVVHGSREPTATSHLVPLPPRRPSHPDAMANWRWLNRRRPMAMRCDVCVHFIKAKQSSQHPRSTM